jgi:hypothetical protein
MKTLVIVVTSAFLSGGTFLTLTRENARETKGRVIDQSAPSPAPAAPAQSRRPMLAGHALSETKGGALPEQDGPAIQLPSWSDFDRLSLEATDADAIKVRRLRSALLGRMSPLLNAGIKKCIERKGIDPAHLSLTYEVQATSRDARIERLREVMVTRGAPVDSANLSCVRAAVIAGLPLIVHADVDRPFADFEGTFAQNAWLRAIGECSM